MKLRELFSYTGEWKTIEEAEMPGREARSND